MKTFIHVFLLATCLVACARGFPGARQDSTEDIDEDNSFLMPSFFDAVNRVRNYLWNFPNFSNFMPDLTNFRAPEGANTTSTTKIIDGHVITINETTYTSGDENSNTAFRIRIIDVKPQNDTTITTIPKVEAPESVETIEENNEISKNGGDTLNA